METLTSTDIVRVWETGDGRPTWHKALLLLAPAFPHLTPADLAALSIGERNALLFALRETVIGPVITAMVRCPSCREPLEFTQEIRELIEDYSPPGQNEFVLTRDGLTMRFRLPNSNDLAAAAKSVDVTVARQTLIRCAVLESVADSNPVDTATLSDELVEALAADVGLHDPLASVLISLACASCEHVWKPCLDIVSFFWSEIENRAKRILEDVVTLARAYGWSESEILSMSSSRRQFYLGAIE